MFQSINNNSVNNNNHSTVNNNIGNTSGNVDVTIFNEAKGRNRDLQSMLGIENKLQDVSDAERLEILTWLSEVDYKRHHKFIASTRLADTGHWLFAKSTFTDWKKSSSSIFWLRGIAGAGKTVLASIAIDLFMHLRQPNQAVAYFYCKDGEIDRQEPQSIFNTVAKQLSLMSPEGVLPEAVISLYKQQKKQGTVIVIDALDECNKEIRCQLLVALKDLCRSSTKGLKIFVTSRNDNDIRLQLENESNVYIRQSNNSGDIKLFVVAEVEKYISNKRLLWSDVRPGLKQEIIDTLISGAGGM
ncbi:hypothetical protein RUND412_004239 [Rhizina undulata]